MVDAARDLPSPSPMWLALSEQDPDDPYAWAMAHRRIRGRPMRHLPALADIARDDHHFVVIQKSAQIGLTELLVNQALWAADTGYAGRGNVLFVMPTENLMSDFAQERFDRAIQDSAYLRRRMQPEPPRRKGADSKRLKRVADGAIYLRGADPGQLASVDADLVLLDEYDQMPEGTLELAQKRLASSRAGRLVAASTPRFADAGINALFLRSDRRSYHLPCPGCGFEQALTWERNVDIERAAVVCRRCREPMDPLTEGRWEAEAPGNDRVRGYQLSRLYAPWANLRAMIEASEQTSAAEVQGFQNSDLGEVFTAEDSGLTRDVLNRCRRNYGLDDYAKQRCIMGVDVGLRRQHVVIREHVEDSGYGAGHRRSRLWFAGEVPWEQLDALIERFNVEACVIDSRPEGLKAREFAARHPHTVWLAQYTRQETGHDFDRHGHPPMISANRTEALDEAFARFHQELVELPRDARELGGRIKDGAGEYYRELLTPTRVPVKDAQGTLVYRWDDHGKADDYAHAEVYCWLAAQAGSPLPPLYASR